MANKIKMVHPATGITRVGYFGFSWTTLFFGPLPALFRSDFVTFIGCFVVYAILGAGEFFLDDLDSATEGLLPLYFLFGNSGVWIGIGVDIILCLLPGFVWAFMYNRYYTGKFLERGYVFNDSQELERKARSKLGLVEIQSRIGP